MILILIFIVNLSAEVENLYSWYLGAGWKAGRTIELLAHPRYPEDVALVSLTTGGLIKEDGSDLRIIDENGNQVQHKIIHCDPFGINYILFKVSQSRKYIAFFGNPAIPRQWEEWEPLCGLFLEVYRYEGAILNRVEDLYLVKSRKLDLMGVFFKRTIFDPLNPLAINKPHLRVYKGFIKPKEAGVYGFALSTDGPSFLFIDDKLILEWPGKHHAHSKIKHLPTKELLLDRGIHRLELYHQVLSWPQRTVLGMKKKGEKRYSSIPPGFFHQPLPTRVSYIKKKGRKWSTDFKFKQKFCCEFFGNWITALEFKTPFRLKHTYLWKFGDNTKSKGARVTHVFLSAGRYRIKLEEKDERGSQDSFVVELHIPLYGRVQRWNKKTLNEIYELTKDYKTNFVDEEYLWVLARIFKILKKKRRLIEATRILTLKYPDFESEKIETAYKWLLDTLLDDEIKEYQRGVEICKEIEQKWKGTKFGREIKLKTGQIYYKMKKYDEAIKIFKSLLDTYGYSAKDKILYSACVGLGDSYLRKGEIEKARNEYEKIMKISRLSYERRVVISGDFMMGIEGYLNRGDLETAGELLEEWGEKVPIDKLDGTYWLLKGRYYLLRGDFSEALDKLMFVEKVSPEPEQIAEALWLIAEVYTKEGRLTDARKIYKKIVEEYPETTFYDKAKGKL